MSAHGKVPAIDPAISASLLEKTGGEPTSTRGFKLAQGEVERYPSGEAYVKVAKGEEATSIVAFLPEGSTPLLEVSALELPRLQVDPSTGKLKPLGLLPP